MHGDDSRTCLLVRRQAVGCAVSLSLPFSVGASSSAHACTEENYITHIQITHVRPDEPKGLPRHYRIRSLKLWKLWFNMGLVGGDDGECCENDPLADMCGGGGGDTLSPLLDDVSSSSCDLVASSVFGAWRCVPLTRCRGDSGEMLLRRSADVGANAS